MEELDNILELPKWSPTEMAPLPDPTRRFTDADGLERRTRYISEVATSIREVGVDGHATSIREVGVDGHAPLGEEEWEQIAEQLVRVHELELDKGENSFLGNNTSHVSSVIESNPIESEYLEGLRAKIRERYKDTTFRPDVWPDPPR